MVLRLSEIEKMMDGMENGKGRWEFLDERLRGEGRRIQLLDYEACRLSLSFSHNISIAVIRNTINVSS
jgi:hypothetical protein